MKLRSKKMKTKLYILLGSLFILTLLLASCSTMNETDNYYGYNNKPTIADNSTTVASGKYNSSTNKSGNDYPNFVSQEPTNESTTVIENNYYFFHPLTYSGYYPWWAPPRHTVVYAPLYGSIYFSYGYDYYYYDWYYWRRYRPYNYAIIYYPYPVYTPYPYYYPYYYHPGWYPEHKHTSNKPRRDTYRDFGPTRGSYTNIGASDENNQPANRRSGTDAVPSTQTGTKTIFQNEPGSNNVRSSTRPTPDAFNTPRNERTRDNISDREIKQRDSPSSETKYESSQKGEQPPPPTRRTISEPAPDRTNSAPSRDRVAPARSDSPRPSESPSRSSNNDSKPTQQNNQQEPANRRSR